MQNATGYHPGYVLHKGLMEPNCKATEAAVVAQW